MQTPADGEEAGGVILVSGSGGSSCGVSGGFAIGDFAIGKATRFRFCGFPVFRRGACRNVALEGRRLKDGARGSKLEVRGPKLARRGERVVLHAEQRIGGVYAPTFIGGGARPGTMDACGHQHMVACGMRSFHVTLEHGQGSR